jgi:transcriptional regulator with XRE-family HTH domain
MTPSHCRAARGLLNWNQDDVASAARVSIVTVRNFENGKSVPQRATLDVMQRAFEAEGIQFLPEDGENGLGVRLRKGIAPRVAAVADASKPAPAPKGTKMKSTRPKRR